MSEKMIASNLHILLFVLALGLQCGLGIVLCGWVPSSEDKAMFYATSFIWGSTAASWDFLMMWYLLLISSSKENWRIFAASAIYMFHRYLGLASIFGIDTVWILPFDIHD